MEEYCDFSTVLCAKIIFVLYYVYRFSAAFSVFDWCFCFLVHGLAIYMNISDEMASNYSTYNNTICNTILYHWRINNIALCAVFIVYEVPFSVQHSMLFLIRTISYFVLLLAEKQVNFTQENILVFFRGINNPNQVSQFNNEELFVKCQRIKCQTSHFNKSTTCWARIYAILLSTPYPLFYFHLFQSMSGIRSQAFNSISYILNIF